MEKRPISRHSVFTAGDATALVGTVSVALMAGQDRSVIVVRDLGGDPIARLSLTPIQGLDLARALVEAGRIAAAMGAHATPLETAGGAACQTH